MDRGLLPGDGLFPAAAAGKVTFLRGNGKNEKSGLSFEDIHFFGNRLEIDEIRNGYVVGEEMKNDEDLEGSWRCSK